MGIRICSSYAASASRASSIPNPGSVGLAYDALAETPLADPWAEYAVLTARDDGWLRVEFRRVLLDIDA